MTAILKRLTGFYVASWIIAAFGTACALGGASAMFIGLWGYFGFPTLIF